MRVCMIAACCKKQSSLFASVVAAFITTHVDRLLHRESDASGSKSTKSTDQTNIFHNEHPRERGTDERPERKTVELN